MQPPPETTIEHAAWAYVTSCSLAEKLAGPATGGVWETSPSPRRLTTPGRPEELVVVERGPRLKVSAMALRDPKRRAELFHTFLHHELQAAELMCWAVLAFVDAPPLFRRGLMAICADEVRHMGMYQQYLAGLGHTFGDFPVRDWFWQRVPSCPDARAFVATLGIGFEGGNLDHTQRFAALLAGAGDEVGAAIQEQVGKEEIAHVRFALKWFRAWSDSDDFDAWRAALPAPLSPTLMRGRSLDHERRSQAGLTEPFLSRLAAWRETPR